MRNINRLVRFIGILPVGLAATLAGAQEQRMELSSPLHHTLASGRLTRPSTYVAPRSIAYQPFKYELPPGHPVDPNSKIVLPNRKVVTVREYIDSLNRIEQGLAQVGKTMRGQVGGEMSPKFSDDALFRRQVAAYHSSLGGSITSVRNRIGGSPVSGGSSSLRDRVGSDQYIGALDGAKTGLTHMTQSRLGGKEGKVSDTFYPNRVVINYGTAEYFDNGFSGGFGDSNFGATLSAHLKIQGKTNAGTNPAFSNAVSEMSASATMAADAQVMGNSFRLLQFNASAAGSDKTNSRSYDLGLYVAGVQIFHDSDNSQGPSLEWQDGFSINWDAQSPTFIFPLLGPFEMKGFVGVKGAAGVTGSFQVRSFSVTGEFAPFVTANAYGEVTAGVDLGVASADVGVHANLVLLDDHLIFKLDSGLTWDPVNHFAAVTDCLLENRLTAMSGSFSLVAHVYGPWGFKLYDWSTELAGWPGETSDLTFSKPAMTKLGWH